MTSEIFSSIETPTPVFKTYIGNLLYSTLDLTDELAATTPVILGQVDVENIFCRDFANISIGEIQHKRDPKSIEVNKGDNSSKGLRFNILSSRQKSNIGSNPTGLSVDTAGGRKVVTVSEYSKRISSDAFTAVIALADEIPLFTGLKASSKASARSLTWLKQLRASTVIDWKETYLFGVTGAFTYDQHNSPQSASLFSEVDQRIMTDAKDLLKLGCDGLVVGGAGMGETLHQLGVAIRSVKQAVTEHDSLTSQTPAATSAASTIAASFTKNIIEMDTSKDGNVSILCREKDAATDKGKAVVKKALILVQEMDSLREILSAVKNGGDLIGTNFPQLLSCHGLGLSWNLKFLSKNNNGVNNDESSSNRSRNGSFEVEKRKSSSVCEGSSGQITENDIFENPNKKQNISDTNKLSSDALLKNIDVEVTPDSVNITDHKYARTGTTTTVITTIITAHKVAEEPMLVEKDLEDIDTKSSHKTPDDYQYAQANGCVINLWEKIHRKDLRPILDNCHCHACKNHTRAYIHHLLLAKEMLGDILLYCHNQYQTVQLFNQIRKIKLDGNVKFDEWSEKIVNLMHEK